MAGKYYFSTRDLLVVAILGSLGGVMSTYVGYVANTINHLLGVPYGAGQVVSGLHILWMVLVIAITRKPGAGVLGGAVKGFVEFVSGSRFGALVILISLAEGLFAEIGFWPFRKHRTLSYVLSGGIGSVSYVILTQLLWQVYDNVFLLAGVSLLAFLSGAVFAGYFTGGVMGNLEDAGIVRREKSEKGLLSFSLPKAFALVLVVAIAFSAIYYFALVQIRDDPMEVRVTGKVALEKEYYIPSYGSQFRTINATMVGTYKTSPDQDYTGLPVSYVLRDARAHADATRIDVVAADGYYQTFNVSEIRDDNLLLNVSDVESNQKYVRLIARGYAGGMWVRNVQVIRVY
jgi:energy-coupling factor transport system substrate-specific component